MAINNKTQKPLTVTVTVNQIAKTISLLCFDAQIADYDSTFNMYTSLQEILHSVMNHYQCCTTEASTLI